VPVDGGADALVVRCYLLLGAFGMAKVPTLYGSIVSSEGEFYSISRRPLNVADATVHAMVLVSTATDGDVSAHIAQVPQANGRVMACGEQQMALMRVEGELVYLTRVLVQSGELYAGAVEVVQDDFAVCSSSRYMRAELAMRPFYVVDAQALALPGLGVCIVEDGSAQIGLVDNPGILHADCFENFLASKDGMGAFTVDVEGRDVEACLMACILRIACANAAGCT